MLPFTGTAAPLLGRAERSRLIAAELERRWDQALQRVRTIDQIALHSVVKAWWWRRLVRTLIKEIVVDVDSAAGEVIVVIHWNGGCTPNSDCRGDVAVKTAVRYQRRLLTQ